MYIKTVRDVLNKDGFLESGILVRSKGHEYKMEILGFVPYSSEWFFDGNSFVICANRVRITTFITEKKSYVNINENERIIPIASCVKLSGGGKEYEVNPGLRLFGLNKNAEKLYKEFLKYWGTSNEGLYKDRLLALETFSQHEEDGPVFYTIPPNNMIFCNSRNIPSVISDDFVCLCSYINKITGRFEYIMMSPEFVIPVLGDEK